MSLKSTIKRSSSDRALPGSASLERLEPSSLGGVGDMSATDLAEPPDDFWDQVAVLEPATKQPISLRVDVDVLDWFRSQGPRYQSRINAVLRSYMTQRRQMSERAG